MDDPTQTDAVAVDDSAEEIVVVPGAPARVLPFTVGDVVGGNVVKLDAEGVTLDLGVWVEGIVPLRELTRSPGVFPDAVVSLGDRIEAKVTSTTTPGGVVRLSVLRGAAEAAWQTLEPAITDGTPVDCTVLAVVRGGLRCDVGDGIDAFLPASQVDVRPVADLSPWVGRTLPVKIIEADRKRHKVVLSHRSVVELERSAARDALMATLQVGEIRPGTVSSVTDIGAFVDIGGADGLVHVSELAWGHVGDPRKAVRKGDEVSVKVLGVDAERGRISLSVKQATENPWDAFSRSHAVGDVIAGKVTKTTDFGAFVEVAPGVEGLVHVSELAAGRVERPSDVVSAGTDVQIRILRIDTAEQKLSLSVRAVDDPDGAAAARGGGGGGRGGGRGGGGRGGGRGRGPKGPKSASFGDTSGPLRTSIDRKGLAALEALKSKLSDD